MNSKNISILFVTVLLTITATNFLLVFNTKKADYTPPPPDFENNQKTYNDLIAKAQKASEAEDYENAFNLFKDALKYYPGNQGILNKMGILKLKGKKYKEAEKIYSDLSEKSPDNPTYKVALAFALLYQYKYSQSELVVNQAQRMRSNDARIHLILAAIEAQKNKAAEAVTFLKRYPLQNMLTPFLTEPFFDPIREEEIFQTYYNSLVESGSGTENKK